MKNTLSFVLTLMFSVPALGLSVHNIYGNKDINFIRSYNSRLFDSFFEINPEFQKCISKELRQTIKNEAIEKQEDWGMTFLNGGLLIPRFEVFYRSVSADGGLEKGVRVNLPSKTIIEVNGFKIGQAKDDYGFEVYLNKDEKCITNRVQKTDSELVYSDGRRLKLVAKDRADPKQYSFVEHIEGQIGEGDDAVLFLKSFTLLYFNRKADKLVKKHLKEFNQIMLRISIKDRDYYTIYFPQ